MSASLHSALPSGKEPSQGALERLASGGYSYKIEKWYNSAAAERALGSLDPPACSSRPRLKAPAEWIHGERLKFDENLSGLFKERK